MFRSLLTLALGTALLAPAVQAASVGLAWDDDALLGRDHGYTSGLRLAYVSDAQTDCTTAGNLGCTVAHLAAGLPGIEGQPRHALLFALKQVMMTPRDITRSSPDFADLPYVGYASVEAGLFSWNDEQLVGYGIRVGVVGPDSGAGWVQRHVHHLAHDHFPRGWSHQLGQDVTAGVYASWLRRGPRWHPAPGRTLALAYGATLNAGSWQSYARAQAFIRYGRGLARNFIPDYRSNGNDAALVGLAAAGGSGWELFFGLQGRYNAYEYVSRHSGPYAVGLRRVTASAMAGASWRFERGPTLTLLLQHASSPLRKGGSRSFGTLALTWSY